MQEDHSPTSIAGRRFSIENLEKLYKQFRFYASANELLDSKTFSTLLVLGLQQGLFPNQWSFLTFTKIFTLTNKFRARPASDDGSNTDSQPLFAMHESPTKKAKREAVRKFVNWKQLLTAFVLINSELPQ